MAILPPDASSEDIEIDPSLGFLSSFVQTALQNGAAPYISEEVRFEMGAVRPSHNDVAVDQSSSGLRFTAYERQNAPEQVNVRTVSRESSPVRGDFLTFFLSSFFPSFFLFFRRSHIQSWLALWSIWLESQYCCICQSFLIYWTCMTCYGCSTIRVVEIALRNYSCSAGLIIYSMTPLQIELKYT